MKLKEMEKLIAHYETYLEQNDGEALEWDISGFHGMVMCYPPTEKYPFWKLTTVGASDTKVQDSGKGPVYRNEYMMAIAPEEKLEDPYVIRWYMEALLEVALYPELHNSFLFYGHSVEWPEEPGEEMVGAYVDMPQMLENPEIVECKLGLFKKVNCMLVILLNREEMNRLLEAGDMEFTDWLFPADHPEKYHFLSERHRTDRF